MTTLHSSVRQVRSGVGLTEMCWDSAVHFSGRRLFRNCTIMLPALSFSKASEPFEGFEGFDPLDSLGSLDSLDSLGSLGSLDSLEDFEGLEEVSFDSLDGFGMFEGIEFPEIPDAIDAIDAIDAMEALTRSSLRLAMASSSTSARCSCCRCAFTLPRSPPSPLRRLRREHLAAERARPHLLQLAQRRKHLQLTPSPHPHGRLLDVRRREAAGNPHARRVFRRRGHLPARRLEVGEQRGQRVDGVALGERSPRGIPRARGA